MSKQMFIIRGLSGCGKSTIAKSLIEKGKIEADCVFESDMWFCQNILGEYRFNSSKLPVAHAWCQQSTEKALAEGKSVAIANTFTEKWEMKPYVVMARKLNVEIKIIDVFDGGLTDAELAKRNTHGVPEKVISQMRARYQHDFYYEDHFIRSIWWTSPSLI